MVWFCLNWINLCFGSHPDKNPDPESKKLFVKIANAYEVISFQNLLAAFDFADMYVLQYRIVID